jgi:hypothetical protein
LLEEDDEHATNVISPPISSVTDIWGWGLYGCCTCLDCHLLFPRLNLAFKTDSSLHKPSSNPITCCRWKAELFSSWIIPSEGEFEGECWSGVVAGERWCRWTGWCGEEDPAACTRRSRGMRTPLLLELGVPCVMEPVLVDRPLIPWVMDVTLADPTAAAGVEGAEEQPCWRNCWYSNDDSGDWFCWGVDCCCRCNRCRWCVREMLLASLQLSGRWWWCIGDPEIHRKVK